MQTTEKKHGKRGPKPKGRTPGHVNVDDGLWAFFYLNGRKSSFSDLVNRLLADERDRRERAKRKKTTEPQAEKDEPKTSTLDSFLGQGFD